MGTKGAKNTPITARINAGLFNQKKGVTEPILNVGPAGVYGNNQTRDIPSPSKLRGYSMKSSPFKQEVVADEKGNVNLATTNTELITEQGKPVTTNVITKGDTPTSIVKPGEPGYAEWEAAVKANPSIEDRFKDKVTQVTRPGEDVVTEKKTESLQGLSSKSDGDAQLAINRRNTIRGGKVSARTKKAQQRKIDKLNRKSGAIDPSTIKKDEDGNNIEGTGTVYNKKTQRNKRQMQQAEDNLEVSSNEVTNAKNQSKQNKTPGGGEVVKNSPELLNQNDMSQSKAKELINNSLGTGTKKTSNPNPETKDTLDTPAGKSTPNFFKKKSPMKTKYFK